MLGKKRRDERRGEERVKNIFTHTHTHARTLKKPLLFSLVFFFYSLNPSLFLSILSRESIDVIVDAFVTKKTR